MPSTKTTKTKPVEKQPETVNKYGANISHCAFTAEAAKVNEHTAAAMIEIAKASAEHAKALTAMADALRGEGGRLEQGISLSHINTPN